jgi:hypothetical protein
MALQSRQFVINDVIDAVAATYNQRTHSSRKALIAATDPA